jgi:hypothetical protein
MIGKDISRFAIPVYFNEPLSFLQKFAEQMEHAHLLTKADQTADPMMRMLLIVAYSVCQYAAQDKRLAKPFNPILGETYELLTPDYRLFCE